IKRGPATGMPQLPFTPRAKKVLEFAIDESRALDHNYVGTEHLLLGLIREREGLAAQVLINLGLELSAVRSEVMEFLGVNDSKNRLNETIPPVVPYRKSSLHHILAVAIVEAEA